MMRVHQIQMDAFSREIISGVFPRNSITLDCTPGGGKTGAATLLANRLLDAGVIDCVLWVVPRLSLAEQVVDAFGNGFGATKGRTLEVVDGQDNLFPASLPNMPKLVGCVTTYQTIAHKRNWERFRDALTGRRCLVIFDEVQFLDDDLGRGWHAKAKAVRDVATFTLVMSGTLWRTDNKEIPFVEYALKPEKADNLLYPLADISYSLRDAVTDRAILPTQWQNRGGLVEYEFNGVPHTHDLIEDGDDEESRKVRCFLSGEKSVGKLLDDMVTDWSVWRKHYQSRMLVIADNISQAQRWKHHLELRHNLHCVLATSKEEASGRKLRHFREKKHGQCLVTVAMAYIGFDCPDLTHLAYLSSIRAPSWMLQSFARVSRFDPCAPLDYDHQLAHAYAPDDTRMRTFMDWLRNEQEMGIARRRESAGGSGKPKLILPDKFDPIDAVPGDRAIESLYRRLEPSQVAALDEFTNHCAAARTIPPSQLYEILAKAQFKGL